MLKKVVLKNYRNIDSLEINLTNINIIISPNGSGKTNILESIFYSVFGKSFRPLNSNQEIISKNKDFAKTILYWDNNTLELILINAEDKILKNTLLNTKKYSSSKIMSNFPIVLFAPNSLDLVTGEPNIRRFDLNTFLSEIYPDYNKSLNKYNILLKNRNAVLKQIRDKHISLNLLDYWSKEIAKTSTLIFKYRFDFFKDINNYFYNITSLLFPNENLTITTQYLPNIECNPEEFYLSIIKKFEDNIQKEIITGKTLYGIHKDDFAIQLNNNNLKFIGSRGQQRIGIFILKIAQLHYYFNIFEKYPLFLIDDLMSELDNTNREKIGKYLLNQKLQFIITSADNNEIPSILIEKANHINLL